MSVYPKSGRAGKWVAQVGSGSNKKSRVFSSEQEARAWEKEQKHTRKMFMLLQDDEEATSQKQALLNNRLTYNNGEPCVRGHMCSRYTSSRNCVLCMKQFVTDYQQSDVGCVYRKKWKNDNTHLVRMYDANRRAQQLKATPIWSDVEEVRDIYRQCKDIQEATGIEYHVDHVIPLNNALVCGLHSHTNLQILKAVDNLSKSNRVWPDMP